MKVNDLTIGWTLVGVHGVIAGIPSFDRPLILFGGLAGQVRVCFDEARQPLILKVIATVGPRLLSEEFGGALGLVVVLGVAVVHVPVTTLGQFHGDVAQEVDPAELLLLRQQIGLGLR